ncbi:hypothetical protein M3D15_07265 [Pseudoclavibacter alba]|uniref:TOMM leader peptide-binding protein n=1 Tax=Pseudoclavibacter albus TaxID=272241 RepID=A0ABT2HXS7_9MICO|nr:hypothetical protein [Pseudoclavibacter alba]MCT2043128.1 hypothetical protein [Pseudoclavibacter alba]
MHYRFRPDLPVLRRGQHSIQLGVGPDALIIDDVPEALERIFMKLQGVGVPAKALRTALTEAGLPEAAAEHVMARLDVVLRPTRRRRPPVVAVRGPHAELLKARLEPEGIEALVWHEAFPEPAIASRRPVLAVELGGTWLTRRRTHASLSRDVPCRLVARCDGELQLGPIIVPGESACLGCRDALASEADPLWPVLAEQLVSLGQREAAVDDPLALELAARVALSWLRDGSHPLVDAQLVVDRQSVARLVPQAVHPACSCQADAALGPVS